MKFHIIASMKQQLAVEILTTDLYRRGHKVSSFVLDWIWSNNLREAVRTIPGVKLTEEEISKPAHDTESIMTADAVICIGPLGKEERNALRLAFSKGIHTIGWWSHEEKEPRNISRFNTFCRDEDDLINAIWALEEEEMKQCEAPQGETINDLFKVLSVIPYDEEGCRGISPEELAGRCKLFGISKETAIRIADTLESMGWAQTSRIENEACWYLLACRATELYETYLRSAPMFAETAKPDLPQTGPGDDDANPAPPHVLENNRELAARTPPARMTEDGRILIPIVKP